MDRRAFIASAAVAPMAGVASATSVDPDWENKAMARIRELTGLCLNDIAFWFEGLDLDRLIANIEATPVHTWSKDNTHAAVQCLYAGSAMAVSDGVLPMRAFIANEIKRKGDQEQVRSMVSLHRNPPAEIRELV